MQFKEIDQQFIEKQIEKDLFEDVLNNQENPVEFFYILAPARPADSLQRSS